MPFKPAPYLEKMSLLLPVDKKGERAHIWRIGPLMLSVGTDGASSAPRSAP